VTSLSRELLVFAGDYWLTALAVFGRVAGILVLLPGVGGQSVPRRLLAALAFLLALALAPQLLGAQAVDQTTLARFALSESVVGLLLGVWIRCVLFAVLIAGAIAAQQMGLQLAVGQPVDGENEAPASRFLTLAATAVFLAADVHLILIGALADSYRLIPFGSWPLASLVAPDFIEAIGRSFVIALQIAGPFIVAGVVYNLVLGMINRAMPQLMVVLIGAPALSLGMLVLFALVLPAMLGGWLDGIARLLPPVFRQ
jgi:flagellar biosynthesis protein FliR